MRLFMFGIYFKGQNIPEWIQKVSPKVKMVVGCPILIACRYKNVTHIKNFFNKGSAIHIPDTGGKALNFAGAPTVFHSRFPTKLEHFR